MIVHDFTPWSDRRFLRYASEHVCVERALWSAEQLDRLERLSGRRICREPNGPWMMAPVADVVLAIRAAS
jgi:hypothetical protein